MEKDFSVKRYEPFNHGAAYFGVSVDNYISSFPNAGVVAFEVGHAGLAVVGSDPKIQYATPGYLLGSVYGRPRSDDSVNATQPGEIQGEYTIPDNVKDFAASKNIPPMAVVRAGHNLLLVARKFQAGPRADLNIHEIKLGGKIGRRESTLSFSISPINTIIIARNYKRRLLGRRVTDNY